MPTAGPTTVCAFRAPGSRRADALLADPFVLLCMIVLVHCCGRIAAFCMSLRLDSMYYTVSAWRFWTGTLRLDDLIPDKPGGQALLTGWCYLIPGVAPSRMVLIPIESAFMLGGYLTAFYLLRPLSDRRIAAAAVLWLAIAFNAFNALETVSDGFCLNENFLLLPLLLAVLAHVRGPGWRYSLARGLALGVALSIKQSAAVLACALVVHEVVIAARLGNWKDLLVGWAMTAAGLLVGLAPLILTLHWSGILGPHAAQLIELSPKHLGPRQSGSTLAELWPLSPMALWCAAGLLVWRRGPIDRRRRSPAEGSLALLAVLWLAAEWLALRGIAMPAMHFYQQLAAPASILAALSLARFQASLRRARERRLALTWNIVASAGIALTAVMPLMAAAAGRAHNFDPAGERREFAAWQQSWSPASAADHLRKGGR